MVTNHMQNKSGQPPIARQLLEITPHGSPSGTKPAELNLEEPVILLTCARSGSTLLRLILDAHPDLACPAETNIVKLCAQLASACQLLQAPGTQPGNSLLAPTSIHVMMNTVFGDYLRRQGKARWCDKSLGTVEDAERFIDIYPKAKFICLYRHCMDVIYSGLEAAPWGLNGYGFDSFAVRYPGNSIAALAAYWCELTERAADFEEAHPEQCMRVYYEDLVADPEDTMEEIFSFIGVPSVPGITGRYLMGGLHLAGPGDHKVGATTAINAKSVGRGIRVPVDRIHPPDLRMINDVLSRLGYTKIDSNWRRSIRPPSLLPGHEWPGSGAAEAPYEEDVLDEMGKIVRARIGPRLGPGIAASMVAAGVLGPRHVIGIAAYGDNVIRSWRIEVDHALVTESSNSCISDIDWLLTGDIGTWSAILYGFENFLASMRSRMIRYVDLVDEQPEKNAHDMRETNARINFMRELLAPPSELGE